MIDIQYSTIFITSDDINTDTTIIITILSYFFNIRDKQLAPIILLLMSMLAALMVDGWFTSITVNLPADMFEGICQETTTQGVRCLMGLWGSF